MASSQQRTLQRLCSLLGSLVMAGAASAQFIETPLATWEIGPGQPGNADFDPQLDATASISGGWYQRSLGSGLTYGQSTALGTFTQGNASLELNIVGKGNGGEYSVPINGVPVNLDTHFDAPAGAVYAGSDTRAVALREAVLSGAQALYSIQFDVIYDVQQMRSIAWQPPEETVNPAGLGQYPQRFFWVGMFADTSNGGFVFTGFDQNNINVFDSQWDNVDHAVYNASFPLTDFGWDFAPGTALNEIRLGILYNSVFGTSPATGNTQAARIYIDNFRLVEQDIVGAIDLNDDGLVNLDDFDLFMSQNLVPSPSLGDFDNDGDNDFQDFLQFEDLYDTFHGAGALSNALAGVPEPATLGGVLLAVLGMAMRRARRSIPLAMAVTTVAVISSGSDVQAQMGQIGDTWLLESWEDLSDWQSPTFYAGSGNPGATAPLIAQSPIGATHGSSSLKITQFGDNGATPGEFSWNAVTSPSWGPGHPGYDALSYATNIGAEHFVIKADVTFRAVDLGEANALNVFFGLDFNGQQAGGWVFGDPDGTTTMSIPLSSFGLLDPADQGNADISSQIAFSGNTDSIDPFSAYIDNIVLEQVSVPDLLTLEINRSTGAGVLRNNSSGPVSWNYLDIGSAGGGLNAAGWNSLDDQNTGGARTWVEAGGSSATQLVEASLLGSHTLGVGQSISIGSLYNPLSGLEDIDFEVRREGGPADRTYDQIVSYVGASIAVDGDYNADGVVNAADYTVWRDALGQIITLPNENATPGSVTQEDYAVWASNYGSSAGVAIAVSVPEPSAALLTLALLAALSRRNRAS
jgi:hypothetical protein